MAFSFLFILVIICALHTISLTVQGRQQHQQESAENSDKILMFFNTSSPSSFALALNGNTEFRTVTSNNETTLIATTSCQDARFIKSALTSLQIPISLDETILCGKLETDLSEHPTMSFVFLNVFHNTLECIADLMVYWKRFEVALVYDKYAGVDPTLAVRYLAKRSILANIIKLEQTDDLLNISLRLIKSNANVILICNADITNSVINTVKRYGAFGANTTWILVSDHVPQQLRGVNISPNSQVTLISPKVQKMTVMVKDQETLPRHNSGVLRNSVQSCKALYLHLKEEEKVSAHLKTAKTIDILDVFYSLKTNSTETIRFAYWNEINRLSMLEILDECDREQRLKGRRVRLTVFQHAPYTFLTRKNGTLFVTGYLKEMFDMLMDTLNMQYTLREIDEVFGVNLNGTFTGYVGVLYRREADMGMNVLAMTNGRAEGVRYAGPLTKAHLAIIYNRPDPIIPPTTYLLPFSPLVWTYSLAALILIMTVTWIVVLISPTSIVLITKSERIHTSLFRTVTFTFLEEVLEYPVGIPAKVVYATLLVTILAMFTHYTSIFTSFLAYQEEKIPFRNLEDVLAHRDYTILIINNTRHQDILQNAKSGVYAKVWQRILQQGDISFEYSFHSGLMKSYTGKYSYLSDGPTCTYLSAGNCSVAFAPVKYLSEHYNMAHRRDFPYTRLFTKGLIKIMEGGVFRRLTIAYSLDTRPSCNFLSGSSSSFGINQIIGLFFVYGCGILLSLVVLIIENALPEYLAYKALRSSH